MNKRIITIAIAIVFVIVVLCFLGFVKFKDNISRKQEVFVCDENDKPLADVFVVIRGQFMIDKNDEFILKTNSDGRVNFKMRGLYNVTVGKDDFYPDHVVKDLEKFDDNIKIVLKKESDRSLIYIDFMELKTGKSIYDRKSSELWYEWMTYIKSLEDDGYFDDLRNKEWFIEEVNNN